MILTPKVKAFCKRYVVDFNGAAAARHVGYSVKRAKVTASELLGDVDVQKFIKTLTDKQDENYSITAERVLKEYARLAFYDIAGYYKKDAKGNEVLKELGEMTADQRGSIIEYDPVEKTMKLAPKSDALQALGKHLKLFTELHEQQHTFTIMPELKLGGKTIIFNVGEPRKK